MNKKTVTVIGISTILIIILAIVILKSSEIKTRFNKTSEEVAAAQHVNTPISAPRSDEVSTTWDCIWFGNYYQANSDTKEPILWRVLSIKGDDVLLISEYCLDAKPYNTSATDITWSNCTLRSWLNGYNASNNSEGIDYSSSSFMIEAFSANEQKAIMATRLVNNNSLLYNTEGGNDTEDKLYLLSFDDMLNTFYGFESDRSIFDMARISKPTKYALENGVMEFDYTEWLCAKPSYDIYNGNCWWWLRSPGYCGSNAADINEYGKVSREGNSITNDIFGVRVAMHLDLSSNLWYNAKTVTTTQSKVSYKNIN